mmetsp:Transcript_4309/g.7187  ORF Transcript_4309/g.7187 Transcript_4309/m.7187 type:complete len:793 (-) Transcript_4309:66-2444(-)
MKRFFRRSKETLPKSIISSSEESSSESDAAPSPYPLPLVLELPDKDDMSSLHDNGASRQGFSMGPTEIDRLLASLGYGDDPTQLEDSVSLTGSSTDRSLLLWPTIQSIASDTKASTTTVPTRNILSKKNHGLLTSFIYLSLLSTHRGGDSSPVSRDKKDNDAVGLNLLSVTPRDVVISSLKAHIHMCSSEHEISNAWLIRETLPVRVDDASLLVRRDDASLSIVDAVVKGALIRQEYVRALEMYETLRRDVTLRMPQSEIVRPLLTRLAIVSLLAGKEKKAHSYSRKLVECSDANTTDFLASLILRGFLQLGCNKLDEALVSWREASYKIEENDDHAALLWNNLACLQVQLGSVNEAVESLEQSLALQKQEQNVAKDVNQALLNISITGGNSAVIAELQHDYGTAIARLEESLMLQESILAEQNYTIRTTKHSLDRVIGRSATEPDAIPMSSPKSVLEEWNQKQPLFEESGGIPLPRAKTDVGGTAEIIQLGPLVNEYSPSERIRESFVETFGFLQDVAVPLKTKRSSLPIDIDGKQIMGAEMKLTDIYNTVTNHLARHEVDDALELLKFCLTSHRNKYGMLHPLVASTLHNIGVVLLFDNQYDTALSYFQQAVRIRIAAFGIDHAEVSATMMKLGLIQVSRRDFDNAQVTFSQILHSRRKKLGYDDPQTIKVLNNIACVHFECGGHVAATKTVEEALEILRKSGVESNRAQLALSILLSNHGFILSKRGSHQEAYAAFQEASEIQQSIYPANHPALGRTMANLGFVMGMTRTISTEDKGCIMQLMKPLQCG